MEMPHGHPLGGDDIAKVLSSAGPVVKAVLLRCQNVGKGDNDEEINRKPAAALKETEDDGNDEKQKVVIDEDAQEGPAEETPRVVLTELIEQIEIDTTPSKSMVAKTLGGQFTFLGQYEDEGIVLMIRNLPDDLVEILREETEEDGDGGEDDMTTLSQQLARHFKVSQLKVLCHEREIDTDGMLEKADLVKALVEYQDNLPPLNPHQLQPPLHKTRVRGDILCMKVAETQEELDDDDDDDDNNHEDEVARDSNNEHDQEKESAKLQDTSNEVPSPAESKVETSDDEGDEHHNDAKEVVVLSNEEFFLDYTKEQYIKFASRTDIPLHEVRGENEDDDGEEEDQEEEEYVEEHETDGDAFILGEDGDEIEEEDKSAMFNLVMNEVLRQYREENGRGPNTQELLEMRANIAKELDVQVAEVTDGDWDKKAKSNSTPSEKKIAFDSEDKVKEFVPDEDEYNYGGAMAIMHGMHEDDDEDEDEDDEDFSEPPTKRIKTRNEDDEDDSKPAAIEKGVS